MGTVDLRVAAGGISDHNSLQNLTVGDPHTQYLLLAGRAGGQIANGGTASADELVLFGSTNAALGRIRIRSPLEVGLNAGVGVEAGDQTAIRYRPTFTTGAAYIGGFIDSRADITYNNAVFVWGLLTEASVYRAAVAPGFAAFTLLNALATITNSGNFDLVQALVLNVGVKHQRSTSGTSTASQTIGVSFAASLQASVAGAVMTRTNAIGINMAPTWNTNHATATVNLGTITGLRCVAPAQALFGQSLGTENLTAYYGVDFTNITFTTSGDKVVVRSAMTDATDRFFLQNNGGARSDFGGGLLLDCGFIQCLADNIGLSLGAAGGDVIINWNGSALEYDPAVGEDLRWSFAVGSHTLQSASFGTSSELRMGFDRFAFGQTGAVGNQVGIFVAPARATTVNGEWTDFLLTQAGNITINHTMGAVYAWTLNSVSLTAGTGSITGEVGTLNIGGMTTSGLGSALTSAFKVTGRSVLRGSVNLAPITASDLTADVNDYQGHGTGNSQRALLRVSTDDLGARVITGFDVAVSRVNDTIWVVNVGTVDNISLAHQNASSSAANRIISPTGANLVLGPNEGAMIWYDDTDSRWRILYHTGT